MSCWVGGWVGCITYLDPFGQFRGRVREAGGAGRWDVEVAEGGEFLFHPLLLGVQGLAAQDDQLGDVGACLFWEGGWFE